MPIASELAVELQTIIHELPERERLILALYYYENLTLVEISQIMNISESDVADLMSRILDQLRIQMKDKG